MAAKAFLDLPCLFLVRTEDGQTQNIADAVVQAELGHADAVGNPVTGKDTVPAGDGRGLALRRFFGKAADAVGQAVFQHVGIAHAPFRDPAPALVDLDLATLAQFIQADGKVEIVDHAVLLTEAKQAVGLKLFGQAPQNHQDQNLQVQLTEDKALLGFFSFKGFLHVSFQFFTLNFLFFEK